MRAKQDGLSNGNLGKRVTLEDVADRAAVSRATVSRVIRGVPGVDAEIVKRVGKAISQTGYRTNLAARALAGGKTQNIAVIFREDFSDLFMNGYWGQVLEGLHSHFTKTEHQLTILINKGESGKKLSQYLLGNHVDGAVFLGTTHNDKLPYLLTKNNIPVVVLGDPYKSHKIARVNGDDVAVGDIAANMLLDIGCKNIGAVTGSDDIATSQARTYGFKKGLEKRGYVLNESSIESGEFTLRGGYNAIQNLLNKKPSLDGVFVLSDMMAVGVVENLNRLGKSVPRDISVLGCDNSPAGEFTNPKLTTIHCNPFHEGLASAELLSNLMNGDPIRSLVFPPELIVRESTRQPKK